jgi:hypothetical protein
MTRRIAWGIGAAVVIFVVVLAYNLAQRSDAKEFLRKTQARIDATEKTLAGLQSEQASLSKTIAATERLLRSKQVEYASKAANEPDEKWRAVWGIYRIGFETNRLAVLSVGQKLEALRDMTGKLDTVAVRSLRTVHGSVSLVAGGISDPSRKAELADAVFRQQADLDAAIAGMIELLVHAKNEISSQSASLKEQERSVQGRVPAGASRVVPMTDEIFKGLESWLKENQAGQELASQVENAANGVGKSIFAVRDISKAQHEFLKSMR